MGIYGFNRRRTKMRKGIQMKKHFEVTYIQNTYRTEIIEATSHEDAKDISDKKASLYKWKVKSIEESK